MIHIVFNEADVKVLNEAILLEPMMEGDVVQINDDFAVGPLNNLYTEEGITARKEWWRTVLEGGDYESTLTDSSKDDQAIIKNVCERLEQDEKEQVWIWAAQNKHDVSGYYWLLNYFKPFQGRIMILYLNNLPFFSEKGTIFYPTWLSEIPAKEFLKARKLAREITPSEFEVDPDEWIKICNENKAVRILEGGKKLAQEGYDFYDADLKKFITPEWQKASKIIHQFLAKAKHTTGDAYLLWRLKLIIEEGTVDVQGKVACMRDFEVKLKG